MVNFTYRLAPEFKFPAGIEDANLVFRFVLDKEAEYDFDTSHIYAVGDSAGAHQLGLYTAICTNPEFAAGFDFTVPPGFVPRAIALNCGKYNLNLDGPDLGTTKEILPDFLGEDWTKEDLKQLNVIDHITDAYPPVFVMTATGDFLTHQAPMLIEKLIECKVEHEFHFYGNKDCELGHVFHLNMRSDWAKRCNDEECEWFKGWG